MDTPLPAADDVFAALFHASPDAMLISRLADGVCLAVNAAFTALTGYTAAEALGQTTVGDLGLWAIPEDRQRLLAGLQQPGGVSGLEISLRRKDGALRPIQFSAWPITFHGEPSLIKIAHDLTAHVQAEAAQRQAEAALQQAHAELEKRVQARTAELSAANAALTAEMAERQKVTDTLRETLESISDGFFSLDAALVVTYFNEAAERLLGRRRAEVLGRPLFEAFPEAQGSIFEEQYTRALREQKNVTFETYFAAAPYTGWYAVHVYAHPGGIAVYFQTVTERHLAEEALNISLTKYQVLFENLPLGVTISDAAGNIVESNREADKLLGLSRAKQLRRQLAGEEWQIIRPDGTRMPPDEYASVRALKENRRVANVEMGLVKSAGEAAVDVTWINVTAAPIPLAGYGVAVAYGDVTERRQAEEKLARLIERLNLATRAAGLGIWDWDIQKNTLVWDERMYALYGVRPQDFAGAYEAWLAGVYPEDRAASDEVSRQARLGERDYDTEFRVLWPDGTIRILTAQGEVVRNAAGQAVRMTGVNHDITERRRAEAALAESERRFRTIFEQAAVGVAQVNSRTGAFVRINQKYCEIVGYSHDEMLHATFQAITHPDDLPLDLQNMRKLLAGEIRTFALEKRYCRKDGALVWVRLTVSPLWAAGEAPDYHIAVVEDITERKLAEEALRESEARHRSLFENMQEGYAYCHMVFEAGQPHDFVYLAVNAAFEHQTGLKNIVGKPASEVIPGLRTSDRGLLEIYGRVAQTGVPEKFEIYVTALQMWFSVSVYSPRPEYFVAVFDVITARKQAEENIQRLNAELEQRVAARTAELTDANAALRRAARIKDEFLATMSHELRTPLTAVQGLSEALQMGIYGALNERQLKALGTIHESGQHLLALINDILDLSKLEAGKLELQVGLAVVDEVCQASLRFIRQQAQKKNVRVSLAYDTQVTLLHADARRLKQMLVNLLSNAVKFTPAGGEVGLTVEGDPAREEIRFVVWDTGIGIAAENLPRLFQPFTQLDSRLAREYEGTGLGLSLVQRMAELHGGEVSAESEGVPGKGSRFTLTLPWRPAEEAAALAALKNRAPQPPPGPAPDAPPAARGAPPKKPVVLLVDDNADTLFALSTFLEAQAYQVHTAVNGVEALALAQALRPAAMLLDIQMPGMDGLEVIHRLRANPALAAMPILALTAHTMTGDRERCLAAGASAYLSKPVQLAELVQTIQALLAPPA